ncbi:MAG: hypothetical protein ACFE95_19670 [Candidatus Hodarchaeota archaeon]
MNYRGIKKLVDQAREDPKFFHALIFNTESILKDIDYLDREIKANLMRNNPEKIIGKICGISPDVETSKDYEP